jgi:predicted NBD/HSP70 family sugar kinase
MSESAHARDVLAILRDGSPRTKSQLAEATNRARSTMTARLAELEAAGLVIQLKETVSTKGRPSTLYALCTDERVVAAVELGARHGTVSLTDLTGKVLAHQYLSLDIAAGPEVVLGEVVDCLAEQLSSLMRPTTDIVGVGVAVPGPVEHASGVPVSPPIMPGWDRFDVRRYMQQALRLPTVPVIVDNDVNAMAIGEWINHWAGETDMILVKVATGIGAGIIANGQLVRGAQGAGGDIGHMLADSSSDRLCRCGQVGCLEALASGLGIAATLREAGVPAASGRDVIELVRSGNIQATRAVREAGRHIGRALADVICVLNPGVIVLGGEMAGVGEPLLAGVREVVYQRSQPLATRRLTIAPAANHELAGAIGVSRLVQNRIFGLED